MGNMQHGQERSILCRLKMKAGMKATSTKPSDLMSATLNYTPLSKGGKDVVVSNDASVYGNCKTEIHEALYRLSIYDTVTKSIGILSHTDDNNVTFEKRVKPLLGELVALYSSISKQPRQNF